MVLLHMTKIQGYLNQLKKLIQLITFSFKTSGKNNTLPIKQNILTQKVHIKMYI